jgi:hypothetical protein
MSDSKGEPTREEIKERAYDIWERRHRAAGFDAEFWLQAERELRAERGLSCKPRTQPAKPVAAGVEPEPVGS